MVLARLSIAVRSALIASTALASACAGWSSWEDGRVVPQRPVGPDDYMVVRGDTVYSIAFRNSLDFHDLARWNGIGSDYLIHPGQVLRLKPSAAAARTAPVATTRPRGRDSTPNTGPRPVATQAAAAQATTPDTGVSEGGGAGYDWVWPTAGTVVRGYGQSGARGIDLGGKVGQPIVAAAPGRVVYSGNALKGYGELIIIKHDELYLSAYGYNSARHVKEGDIVTAGQPIGEMGRGPENKAMLHFEIRRKGKPIDPTGKLPAARGTAAKS